MIIGLFIVRRMAEDIWVSIRHSCMSAHLPYGCHERSPFWRIHPWVVQPVEGYHALAPMDEQTSRGAGDNSPRSRVEDSSPIDAYTTQSSIT